MPHIPTHMTDQGERDRRQQWAAACLRHYGLGLTGSRGMELARWLDQLVDDGWVTAYAIPETRRG
jgi:hypothetical protein